eukprot:7262359-Pyramimonas_sp.AAC.1
MASSRWIAFLLLAGFAVTLTSAIRTPKGMFPASVTKLPVTTFENSLVQSSGNRSKNRPYQVCTGLLNVVNCMQLHATAWRIACHIAAIRLLSIDLCPQILGHEKRDPSTRRRLLLADCSSLPQGSHRNLLALSLERWLFGSKSTTKKKKSSSKKK